MWARLGGALVAVAVMAAPDVLGYGGFPRGLHVVAGALGASFALIAINEVTRPLRWAGLAIGVALAVASVVAWHGPAPALVGVDGGALMAVLSLPPGRRRHAFAGGWSSLWGG